MGFSTQQLAKVERAQEILGYRFTNPELLKSAITHPSAAEGKDVKYSYERLEFLGDSILGAIIAREAFDRYPTLDEGGLTRIKVSLVSGATLAKVADSLGFASIILFGSSEKGTGKRGLHSALENVYEAIVAALYLDGGLEKAHAFVSASLFDHMSIELAREPENPKSILQERFQEFALTPSYALLDTQGPPHDRTFTTQVLVGDVVLAVGKGRTKKEAESKAAKQCLRDIEEKGASHLRSLVAQAHKPAAH